MSGFLTAELTAGNYTDLRGNHQTDWYVYLCPNTLRFSARVNQVVFGDSFAQVTFDTVTTGAYTDVLEGDVVHISHSSSIREAFFVGRVRKAATSTILYINETSLAVADNDYLFVTQDPQRVEPKHPHEDDVTGVILYDWSIPFRRLLPLIRDVQSEYKITLSGGVADLAFTPTGLAMEAGDSIASWANTIPGGTYQAGSGASQNFTVRYTSVGVYYPRIVATTTGGRTNWLSPMVIVDDAAHSLATAGAEVNGISRKSSSAGLTLKSGTDLNSVLDNTKVVVVSETTFGDGSTAPILSNIIYSGRLRDEDNRITMSFQHGLNSDVSFKLEGVAAQMGRVILASIAMRRVTASSVFGEVNALTLWRGMGLIFTELTTLSNFTSISFDNESGDYGIPLLGADNRSAGDSIEAFAFAINAFMKFAPSGELKIVRHASYLSSSDKAALLTRANYTNADWNESLRIHREHVQSVGRVIGFGGSYNTSSGKVTALRAIAPSRVFSAGAGRQTVNSQVLPVNLSLLQMKTEIALRTGAEYARRNQQTVLDGSLPSNYEWLYPAPDEYDTWALSGTQTRTGRTYTSADKWLLDEVTLNHDYAGHFTDVTARWVLDSANIAAQVMAEIQPDELPWSVPAFNPFPASPFPMFDELMWDGAEPPPEDEQPYTPEEVLRATSPGKHNTDPEKKPDPAELPSVKKGNVVAVWNSSGLWVCDNFNRTNSPNWRNITPGTGINDFKWDRFGAGGWTLTDDGTDSDVWRADNLMAGSPTWNSGVLTDSVFTLLRGSGKAGRVYVYAPNGTADVTQPRTRIYDYDDLPPDFEFTTDPGPGNVWTALPTLDPGGFIASGLLNASGGGDTAWIIAEFEIVTTDGTNVRLVFDENGAKSGAVQTLAGNEAFSNLVPSSIGGGEYAIDVPLSTYTGSLIAINFRQHPIPTTTAMNLLRMEVTDTEIVETTKAQTRRSIDGGATFEAIREVGDATDDAAGFSARQNADIALAAVDGKVRTAADGGAYSDATGGGVTGTFAKTITAYGGAPGDDMFLKASGAAIGGETLWKVIAGIPTAITPNDGVNDGIAVSASAIVTAPENDSVIFALMNFGGTIKLARSTNAGVSWGFTTVNSGALYVSCHNAQQVYVVGSSSIQYSSDGGVTFVSKVPPGASLTGIEVR